MSNAAANWESPSDCVVFTVANSGASSEFGVKSLRDGL
jgi:hypothetical protein